MANLNRNLNSFANGQIQFSDLTSAIRSVAASNPEGTAALRLILTDAQSSGVLDQQQLEYLIQIVDQTDNIAISDSTEDDPGHLRTLEFHVGDTSKEVATIGIGSVIKRRFELIDMLGRGGMGIVYRAKDRIRVEAKDRNPYVAIKVLNENFKAHPESFVALQRECSRTQKLAHPNIATVYDFDRTGPVAYLTMEILEGKPLNEYITNDLPKDGLEFSDAWPLIDGLGQALSFAHQRSIVHSDFKPANAFMTDTGTVKVLDFGIARAFKKPGSEHEETMFDAAKLGALTPRYASCEMLAGEPPDPRDDIYALGIVSYLMLSGAHPYDGKAANVAQSRKLKAPTIAGLSKLQNRALQNAVAFNREERTGSVDTFLHELRGESTSEEQLKKQSRLLKIISIGFGILVLCTLYLLRT